MLGLPEVFDCLKKVRVTYVLTKATRDTSDIDGNRKSFSSFAE